MDEIILPLVEIDAIEGLDVIEGFACRQCAGLCGTLSSIRKHCREEHGWVTSNGINSTCGCTDLSRDDVG
jgi:triacylglycerol esterase/lipase EstA (alpha/beta hydrolase family)